MSERPITLFISHASEDKQPFVEGLYGALKATPQFDVWYDTDSLHLGDSLTFEISGGLKNCDYAIVVLSPTYITKKWCKLEFASMIALETNEKKIILPIWHDITREQVVTFSPLLADRVAIPSTTRTGEIILAIEAAVFGSQKARQLGDPLRKQYSELEDALADHDANERVSRSEQGVRLVQQEVFHLFDIFEKRLDQIQGSIPVQKYHRDQPTNYRDYYPAVGASGRFRVNVEIGYLNTYGNVTSYAKLVVTLFAWPDDTPPQLAALLGQKVQILHKLFAPRFTANENVQWKNDEDANIYTTEQVVAIALTLFKDEIALRLAQG